MQIRDLIPWARGGNAPGAPHAANAPDAKDRESHPMLQLQEEMNRTFENFWNRMNRSMPGFARSETGASGPGVPSPGSFGSFGFPFNGATPRSDVVETDDGIEVTLELPGLNEDDIEVTMTDDVLTVKGEKKVERQDSKKGFYLSERSYGAIHRSIPLPPGVDTQKAEASFRNGVLTVRLPQSEEARARVRRIDVKSA